MRASLAIRSARALALLGCFCVAQGAHAQPPTYDLLFLGPGPGPYVNLHPLAVNDLGVVVGRADIGVGNPWVPFVASPTQAPALLPLLPGDTTGIARAINDAGVIVGVSIPPAAPWRAVRWLPSPSGYTVVPIPPASNGMAARDATSINELGDVVGELELPFSHGFAWSASGGTIDLAIDFFNVKANAINDSRQVVGANKRLNLDSHVLETASVLPGTSLTHINGAGVCTWSIVSFPFSVCGTYEFGGASVTYGVGSFVLATGIDYAGSVLYRNLAAPGVTGDVVHFDVLGNFQLASLVDPAFAQWQIDGMDSAMSDNGLLAVHANDPVAGQLGVALLTQQRFHAILKGSPGNLGVPVLTGEGTLQGGSQVTLRLTHAWPSAPLGLIAGLSRVDLPFYGGTLVPAPTLVLTGLSTDPDGKLTLAATWPTGLPSGTKLYLQEFIADPSAPFGVAGSNALECVTP